MKAATRRALALIAAAMVAGSGAVWAAERYPARPIRLVIPVSSDGGQEAMGRLVGERLAATLRQRVVVDHRAGTGGMLGATMVIKAPADGHTLLLGHTGSLAITLNIHANDGYDPRRDLAAVGMIGRMPFVMVAHARAAARTVKELINLARIAPGRLNFGSAGAGSDSHLAAELFLHAAGIRLAHVPYRGSAQAVASLVGNKVDVLFSVVPPVRAHVEGGRLRALAITSPDRLPQLPGVPTVAESAVPGFEAVLNYGLAGPAGLPVGVVSKLNDRLNALLQADEVRTRLAASSVTLQPGTPAQYAAVIAADYEKWGGAIRRAGIKAD
jgi:tripartite-type tricarboxylate transporter receptor subunit TctC